MKIAITGSGGLVGTALKKYFSARGDDVWPLMRSAASEREIFWNPAKGQIEREKLEGLDAVIHLAGANIAGRRWSAAYKKTILASRVQPTRLLCEALAGLTQKPKVLLSASAVGYYGAHNPAEGVLEGTPAGNDFLAGVCRDWEEAATPATGAGIRTVAMRFGVVLSVKGGALKKMLPAFQLGLGGPLGSGKQMMSWVALAEIPKVAEFLLANESMSGPVNVVAPAPVTNACFTQALGKALKRPAFLPVPAFAVKLLFGEMGESLLLNGAAVLPGKLKEAGYSFRYPDIDAALRVSLKEN